MTDRAVSLRPGVTVPEQALRLLWDLSARGIAVAVDGRRLLVGPRRGLTSDDVEAILYFRDALAELVRADEVVG